MDENNISIKTSVGKFSYRVGAIIMNSDSILMAKNSRDSYYYTVGGRVKFGETAQEAILREIYEETKVILEIERLAFIHENIFQFEKEPFHEIVMFFLMKQNNEIEKLTCKTFDEEYGKVTLTWLAINGLENIELYPEFLKTELNKPIKGIQHYISKYGKTTNE